MFTVIKATVEDTHSLESIQESEPLMIQHASVDCADHMQSTGFTLVLSESMSTADSEEPGSLTHDRKEPSEEPASLTHDRREPSEEPASLTHESMSTADSEGPASLTHDEMRQPNPQGTGTRKGMKRKWASEENICFMNFFRDELREKKMPSGSKIMGSLKILTGRTVAQIRARVHNIIMEKQKWKKNC
ncbi:uncharacterized protein LOC127872958 isoform X2 [Dreissena polymorpha]|uniref:Uncharacterized protein n=2 Tax=Dreissena polymorpha TaxID=45954 RepID=A0A9D4KWM0_DREPO|nr:uncharacterized protein LOC127841564 isoform X2 [Dreissena polymorpha]XP_052272440.1 uncharacterized protein LOC127872958 isoform X2 [Dreissena polymorpha]KAH3847008.1 hypothetical protein DPMN_089320 [Dreissena polymorpha]